MSSSRILLRTSRNIRVRPTTARRQIRFQSSQPTPQTSGGASGAVTGGLAGAGAALAVGYAWYHFSGAKTVVNTVHQTKSYMDSASRKLTENAPEPNEALRWLRQISTYYAGFVPGASGYVDTAFKDLEKVQEKHADEVDEIVQSAYKELKDASKSGLSVETAQKTWDIVQKYIKELGELAGDAAEDILDNHPEIKKKVGGSLDQLKNMGNEYGPEAKKQVDETWNQISDIIKGGFSADTAMKIKKLVDERVQKVKQLGDEAWKKGMEQAKPYLDKNPKIKEIIEKNQDALKQGNFGQLYEQVKKAATSGDTGDLEKYVKDAAGKAENAAKDSGFGGMEQYLDKIPGGDQILPKLSKIQEAASKHGKEAEQIFKDTINDISKVLSKRSDEAEKLAEKAKKDT
ncbi:hypothetical protein EJ08DRAFT_173490 [Tothia fuscella]|uniref:Uncharacterized protein n=1 Tax=Tothia fuscella TaxID=1048955 RepID=A0A9P4NU02_9PEZI|nr:hypothetical protein EJ08DRAFT_173490 [Tothia fuscella]